MVPEFSPHARVALSKRPFATVEEILEAVIRCEPKIHRTKHFEALVVVKRFTHKVVCPDGSNGNLLIACVQPRDLYIKTIMLQRSEQMGVNQPRYAYMFP